MSEDNLALMIKLSLHLVMNQVLSQMGVDRGGLRIQDGTSRVPGGRHQGEAERWSVERRRVLRSRREGMEHLTIERLLEFR